MDRNAYLDKKWQDLITRVREGAKETRPYQTKPWGPLVRQTIKGKIGANQATEWYARANEIEQDLAEWEYDQDDEYWRRFEQRRLVKAATNLNMEPSVQWWKQSKFINDKKRAEVGRDNLQNRLQHHLRGNRTRPQFAPITQSQVYAATHAMHIPRSHRIAMVRMNVPPQINYETPNTMENYHERQHAAMRVDALWRATREEEDRGYKERTRNEYLYGYEAPYYSNSRKRLYSDLY